MHYNRAGFAHTIREAGQVAMGDDIAVRLARGELGATVHGKKP
ncbi:MAG: hypothetical protein ACREUU_11135 [Gammaproteobacteria bacterium]